MGNTGVVASPVPKSNHEVIGKMKKPFIVDVRPVRRETISPSEYLKLLAENPTLIERAEFIAPRIGRNDFGVFDVRYTRSRHKQVVHG